MREAHERRTGQISPTFPGRRAALVIAHPGHELRVHAWVELAQPLAFVLTDGSGHTGQSRLASTSRLLERTGAAPGGIYGRLTDGALYAAILGRDVDLVAGLARELAQALVDERIDYVVGDALEGHNPGHDLCRVIIDAAAELAGRAGQRVACLDFPLVGRPNECPPTLAAEAIPLALDDAAFARKLAATHPYAELAGDAAATFAETGVEAFRLEAAPDLIHGQHHLETMTAMLRFPGVPAIYVCHGWAPWQEAPPHSPRILRYLAVDHACRDRLVFEHGISEERVRVLFNFVDLERFGPRAPLPARPARALVFSN